MWNYEGTLNKEHTELTLFTKGPCPMTPDKLTKIKDVLTLTDKSHKLYTSYILDDHGDWCVCMEARGVLKKRRGTVS